MTHESDCQSPPGIWMGPDYICDCQPCIQCAGACCWPDGTCTYEPVYRCCINGGNPNCGDTCDQFRCATTSVPGRGEDKSWGSIKRVYR